MELYTSLYCFDELRYIGVTWIEAGVGVDDPDDWAGERVFAVASGFYESLA
jgi:hypothetical protein